MEGGTTERLPVSNEPKLSRAEVLRKRLVLFSFFPNESQTMVGQFIVCFLGIALMTIASVFLGFYFFSRPVVLSELTFGVNVTTTFFTFLNHNETYVNPECYIGQIMEVMGQRIATDLKLITNETLFVFDSGLEFSIFCDAFGYQDYPSKSYFGFADVTLSFPLVLNQDDSIAGLFVKFSSAQPTSFDLQLPFQAVFSAVVNCSCSGAVVFQNCYGDLSCTASQSYSSPLQTMNVSASTPTTQQTLDGATARLDFAGCLAQPYDPTNLVAFASAVGGFYTFISGILRGCVSVFIFFWQLRNERVLRKNRKSTEMEAVSVTL